MGADAKLEVTLNVEEMAKAIEEEQARGKKYEEDEISEPDEDSLAGQMSALRRGSLSTGAGAGAGKKKKRVVKEEEEEEDDTSGTEGDEDQEDTSETDTSTDEGGD